MEINGIPPTRPATTEGRVERVRVPKKPRVKKSDFPKWADWCEHKKQEALARAAKAQAEADKWEAQKEGPPKQVARKKERMDKLRSLLAAYDAEESAQKGGEAAPSGT